MASTHPFEVAESTDADADAFAPPGARARTGRRASRRAALLRERRGSSGEQGESGFPDWAGLQPIVLFTAVPAGIVLLMVATGGQWPIELLYVVAGCLGLYVFLSALRSVELVLACTLFYLPFSTTYVIPIAPGVNGTNMLILLGLFASVLRAMHAREGWLAWAPGTAIVFFFGLLSSVSAFTVMLLPGGYALLMYSELLNYKAWLDQFLLYFIALSCIRDVAMAKRMVVYMAMGSIVLVLYSVPEMLDKMGRSTIEKSRIEGPHQQSNNFGGFVAYTLLPLVAFFVVFVRDIRAWLLSPYFLLAAKVLISTFSRGAYVAMAVGGLMAGFLKGKAFVAFWATLALCFFLVFPQFLPESIVARLESITERGDSTSAPAELDKSSSNRLILWRAAAEMTLEDPWLGKGFKAFPKLKADYTEEPVDESDPHSMYLYLASQMGLPVLSLFLLLLGYSFWLGRRLAAHRQDRFIRAIGIGGAASTTCYAIICLFGSRAVNLEFTAYFWVYFVVMQVICQREDEALLASAPKKLRSNAFAARDEPTLVADAREGGGVLEAPPDDAPAATARRKLPGKRGGTPRDKLDGGVPPRRAARGARRPDGADAPPADDAVRPALRGLIGQRRGRVHSRHRNPGSGT